MNQSFLFIMLSELTVIVLDIISSYADENYADYSVWLLYVLNISFYLVFMFRSYLFYVYSTTLVRLLRFNNSRWVWIYRAPLFFCSLIALSSPLTHSLFYIDSTGFHHGPLRPATYFCLFFYAFLSLAILLLVRENLLSARDFFCAILFNLILLTGGVIRWSFPRYLLMDTFCVMAMIVIYLNFENPEYYIERRAGTFNKRALSVYIKEPDELRRMTFLGFRIHNYNDVRELYGSDQMDRGLKMIGEYLTETFPEVCVFYNRGGRFLLIGEMNVAEAISQINGRMQNPWSAENAELYLNVGFAYIDPDVNETSAQRRMEFINNVLESDHPDHGDAPIDITNLEFEQGQHSTEIKRALEYAIKNNSVEVYFQPVVSAATGAVAGAEALARIRDENGKLIMPGEFIAIAEANGRINQIGKIIFEETCKFLHDRDIDRLGLEWVNVNISPMQFLTKDLVYQYKTIVDKYGLDAGRIHLEITEDSLIDEDLMIRQMEVMQEQGFRFALDDYGRGYSNIVRLKKCPFVNIKIDMGVVWDHCRQPDKILPAMISGFRDMGFTITAEGVETEEIAACMKEIGCDYLQGFLYSAPLPVNEFFRKIKESMNGDW